MAQSFDCNTYTTNIFAKTNTVKAKVDASD